MAAALAVSLAVLAIEVTAILAPAEPEASAGSYSPVLSAGGRWVAFSSDRSNLVPGDTNGQRDVFLWDRTTGRVVRVSVSSSGEQANAGSRRASISADGRYVAFQSSASNLVPGDRNGAPDVFVWDRLTRRTVRIGQGNAGSYRPAISADGAWVAFESSATNLIPHDTNGMTDVFVWERKNGVILSMNLPGGGAGANGPSVDAAISRDGRYVAFQSSASNLVRGDTNGVSDVFVRDRMRNTIRRVSVPSTRGQADGGSTDPSLSADGRTVAFVSSATNLVAGDTNGVADVFVRSLARRRIVRVSVASAGSQSNGPSGHAFLSADGSVVAFDSKSSNLVAGDTNGVSDVFARRLPGGPTRRVSVSPSGQQGDGDSYASSLTPGGALVGMDSIASNLPADDTPGAYDIVIRPSGA